MGDIYDESPPTGQGPVNQAKNYLTRDTSAVSQPTPPCRDEEWVFLQAPQVHQATAPCPLDPVPIPLHQKAKLPTPDALAPSMRNVVFFHRSSKNSPSPTPRMIKHPGDGKDYNGTLQFPLKIDRALRALLERL